MMRNCFRQDIDHATPFYKNGFMGGGSDIALPMANNITAGATLYSTLASVLCGFAFTAIVLLVVTWLGDSSRAQHVLVAAGRSLVAAFLGLLIMAVGYAAESTNASNDGLTASENTILAVGFVGVGVVLLYSVVLMLDAADETVGGTEQLSDVAKFARAAACLVNLLITGLAYDAIGLYENFAYGYSHPFTALDGLGAALVGVALVVTVWAIWRILRFKSAGLYFGAQVPIRHLIESVGLGYPVLAAVGYLAVDTTMPNAEVMPAFWAFLILVMSFSAAVGATIYLVLTRPARADEAVSGAPYRTTDQ
jgi:hypothetical protein